MKLIEALQLIRGARDRPEVRRFALCTGFTPLHLGTFVHAELQAAAGESARVELDIGMFGDVIGNVRRTTNTASLLGVAVALEWSDLDPRLGLRESARWAPEVLDDVERSAGTALERIANVIRDASQRTTVAVALPTLPIAPIAFTRGAQASRFELALRSSAASFATEIANIPSVRVVGESALARASMPSGRADVRSDLATGFPYTHTHASALAKQLVSLLLPPVPKKGLITDLDDTLWRGILGEVGVAGVGWDLEHIARVHGMYQQIVAALADSGVLVAVASKNDAVLVEEAFRRPDILLTRERVFPMLANWGAKSSGIDAVLDAWNVGADSLVFVDDSPIELAEVQHRHPEVECRLFPKNNPDDAVALFRELRDMFGRSALQNEDALRRDSLRSTAAFRASAAAGPEHEESFLSGLDAQLTIQVGPAAANERALDLINKTNQFNANGRRYLESEWRELQHRADSVIVTVAYADKFGPLGTIAVVTGTAASDHVRVDRWVMSCRAFARRIEYATLRALFDAFCVENIVIAYEPTPRNGPVRDFLQAIGASADRAGDCVLRRVEFDAAAPQLYHRTERAALTEPING